MTLHSPILGQVLSTYCVPGTVLGNQDTEMSRVPVLTSSQRKTYAERREGVETAVRRRLWKLAWGGAGLLSSPSFRSATWMLLTRTSQMRKPSSVRLHRNGMPNGSPLHPTACPTSAGFLRHPGHPLSGKAGKPPSSTDKVQKSPVPTALLNSLTQSLICQTGAAMLSPPPHTPRGIGGDGVTRRQLDAPCQQAGRRPAPPRQPGFHRTAPWGPRALTIPPPLATILTNPDRSSHQPGIPFAARWAQKPLLRTAKSCPLTRPSAKEAPGGLALAHPLPASPLALYIQQN